MTHRDQAVPVYTVHSQLLESHRGHQKLADDTRTDTRTKPCMEAGTLPKNTHLSNFLIVNVKSSISHFCKNIKNIFWGRDDVAVQAHQEALVAQSVDDDGVVHLGDLNSIFSN